MNEIHKVAGSTPPARIGGCYSGRGARSRLWQLDQAREYLAAFLEGTRSRILQEQAVRALSVLGEAHLSEAVRAYLADSLDAALQQEQQIAALREEVRTLEAQWVYSPARQPYGITKRR